MSLTKLIFLSLMSLPMAAQARVFCMTPNLIPSNQGLDKGEWFYSQKDVCQPTMGRQAGVIQPRKLLTRSGDLCLYTRGNPHYMKTNVLICQRGLSLDQVLEKMEATGLNNPRLARVYQSLMKKHGVAVPSKSEVIVDDVNKMTKVVPVDGSKKICTPGTEEKICRPVANHESLSKALDDSAHQADPGAPAIR